MKKVTVILLAAAACLVLTGVVVFCITMAANQWDFSRLDNDKQTTRTFDVTGDFRNISVLFETEDVEFRLSGDGKCKVVCVEREKEPHTVSVADGTLKIERTDKREWYDHLTLFSFDKQTITVYLTETGYEALRMKGSTGDVKVPGDFGFGSIEIAVSTGDVDCRATSSGLLRIGTSTGDIRLENLLAGELDLAVSTGRVEAASVVCGGDVTVRVSTGKTILTDITCKNLYSDGSTGDISLKNVTASGIFSIERDTGSIKFERCDAGELKIETDTGDVSGSLLSDKVFFTHSSTGRISVPETTSGGKCSISTDTGSIRIEILRD